MKRFIGFVKKEFYHIFRDKRSMFILLGMPIVQILLFGFAITNEINNVNIAILDKSKDAETQKIINTIGASRHFKIKALVSNEDQIEAIFKKGTVKAVLVFEKDFAHNLQSHKTANVQVITDATDPNTANTITNYVQSILQHYQLEVNKSNVLPPQIHVESRLYFNPALKSDFYFCTRGDDGYFNVGFGDDDLDLHHQGKRIWELWKILLVSPIKPFQVIIGKVFPYIFLSIINAVMILVLGYFVFGMPIEGSVILLAMETVLFIVTSLALGILISTFSETQQTAMMMSLMGLMLPVNLLSGFIFPITSLPVPLQYIGDIIPAKWFIAILKGIMLKGVGITILWKETLILFGMMVFFLVLSIKKYKIRLE